MSWAKELYLRHLQAKKANEGLPPAGLIEDVQAAIDRHKRARKSALYDLVKADLEGVWSAFNIFAAIQYIDLMAHPEKCKAFYKSKRGRKYYRPGMTLEEMAWGSARRLAAYVARRR